MKKVSWECWAVVKNTYTGELESTERFIAVTDDNTDSLDVLTSLYNKFLTKIPEDCDDYLLDIKRG